MFFSPFPGKIAELQLLILAQAFFSTPAYKELDQSRNYTKLAGLLANLTASHLLHNHFRNTNKLSVYAVILDTTGGVSAEYFICDFYDKPHSTSPSPPSNSSVKSKRNMAVQYRIYSHFTICNANPGFVQYRNLAQ